MKIKKRKILPPIYFLIFIILLIGTYLIVPSIKISHPLNNWIGMLLIVLGVTLNLWSDNIFKEKKTTIKPNEIPLVLITSGPYKISRHPMYLGMVMILFGISITLGSIITFILPIIFIVLIQKLFIIREEEALERKFGQEYINYKKKVRCWI